MYTYIILASVFIAAFSMVLFFSMPKINRSLPKKNIARLEDYVSNTSLQKQEDSLLKKSISAGLMKILSGTRKILPKNIVE